MSSRFPAPPDETAGTAEPMPDDGNVARPDLKKKPKRKKNKSGQTMLAPEPGAAAKSIMPEWGNTRETMPVPGTQRDAPGNTPSARVRSQLASGHHVSRTTPGGDRFDPSHYDVHDWNQVLTVSPLATVQSDYGGTYAAGGGCGALASSIEMHQGKAVLGLQDMSQAANASFTSQLRAAPSHDPAQYARPAHQAPSGYGETGSTPVRPGGLPYLPAAGASLSGYSRSAPGE